MATFYSGWVAADDWRLRLDVSVATSNGSYTYTANLYCQSTYATLRNSGFAWYIDIDGQRFSGTKTSPNIYPGGTSWIASASKAVSRTTSAKTVSFVFGGSMPSASSSAYRAGITGTGTQSLPALPSHTVSYNANGGSGAPGNQTKWYGSILTLSTTKPTRTGYTFRIWNTASNGSGTNYSPGGQYGLDTAVTLYAQWTEWTYTVSYNANGGSGAPGNQTKWYTATLTLSSTVPTRANYNFKGWATSPTGGVAYQPGSGYAANASVTLYAVWEIAYVAPIITNVGVDRCDSAGTVADDGTYLKVSFSYQLDATYSGGMDYIQLSYKLSSASSYGNATTYTPSGMSGSFSQVIGAGSIDTEYAYDVRIIVKDHKGSTTATRSVGPLSYIIDFSPQGGVAIGEPAPNEQKFNSNLLFTPKVGVGLTRGGIGSSATNIWYKIGNFNSADIQGSCCIIDIFGLNGQNEGAANQGGQVRIHIIDSWNASGYFNVSVDGMRYYYPMIKVKVLANSYSDCDVWIRSPYTYADFYCSVQTTGTWTYYDVNSNSTTSEPTYGHSCAIQEDYTASYKMVAPDGAEYAGLTDGWGSDQAWVRSTASGFLPQQSGQPSASSLGTDYWVWNSIWVNNLNWTGSGLRGRVMKQLWSGSWSSGSIGVAEAPYYNLFAFKVGNDQNQDWWVVACANPTRGNTASNVYVTFWGYNAPGQHLYNPFKLTLKGTTFTINNRFGNALLNDNLDRNATQTSRISNIYGIL